jgi:DNA-binding NarL/FixJ family response regulator
MPVVVTNLPTVVLADDHPIWRDGLRADLRDGFRVVGEAGNAPDAVEVVRSTRPDLVVSDLHMPGGGGLAVVKACAPDTKVIMLTVSEQERDLLDAVAAGAVGYLVKSTPGPELVAGLRRALAGEPVFSPALASLVLGEFRRLARASGPTEALSDREREVLQLVARGHAYKEIGAELYIAEKTVENHVRNILRKLHLSRRHELVRFALEHGIE